ncbi:hypothetical protein GCM10022419_037120 [Nonomuraea rosea]|uniref:Uncharacterized protein n=1 Tax=Nonomuraea rosea TaxID=638574 RepID=A0ABP6WLH7_9ACTN
MNSNSWLDGLFGLAEIFLLAPNTLVVAFLAVPVVTVVTLWLRGARAHLALKTARISLISVGTLLLMYAAYIALRHGGVAPVLQIETLAGVGLMIGGLACSVVEHARQEQSRGQSAGEHVTRTSP